MKILATIIIAIMLLSGCAVQNFNTISSATPSKTTSPAAESSVDITSRSSDGKTSLHSACMMGDLKTVELLIAKGADIEARDNNGKTPLHYAVYPGGNKEIVKLLLSKKANINAKDINDMTPVYDVNDKDMADFLIKKGAKVKIKNKKGWSPFCWACKYGTKDVAETLFKNGADFYDLRTSDTNGTTLLQWTCLSNDKKDMADFLIENGSELEAVDKDGNTALHYASDCGNKDIVELLVSKGAKTNVKNNSGDTPADKASKSGKYEVVEYLLKHNAE